MQKLIRLSVLIVPLAVAGTASAQRHTVPPDGPALGRNRITQDDITSGRLTIKEIRRKGMEIFSTPFNKLDGFGDGPMDPDDPVLEVAVGWGALVACGTAVGSSLPQADRATMAISMNALINILWDCLNNDRFLIRLYKRVPPEIFGPTLMAQSIYGARIGQIHTEHDSKDELIVMLFPICGRWQPGQVVAFKTPFSPSGMARADARLQRAITNRIIRYGSISRMNGDTGAPTV